MKKITATDLDYICDIKAPCFQALLPEEATLISLSKTQVQFRKNDNLTKQGAFAPYILFMIKGLAIQYIEGDQNKNYNLRIIKPGEFIGLSSIFADNIFNYSSIAINDCQVILVEKAAILQLISKNGSFGLSLARRYTQQNVNLFDKLHDVLYRQMMGRIAQTLIYIGDFKNEFNDVFTLLSRKHLADFAGITTESLVKMLKTLDKEAVIKLKGKNIELLNLAYLRDLSKKG